MNSRAFELAISTLVVVVIGILVLIGLAYVLTGGFKTLNSSTKPFLDTTTSSSIKQACSLACSNSDKITFCCSEYNINTEKIKCSDSRLEVSCSLSCENYNCDSQQSLSPEECRAEGGTVISDPGDGSVLRKKCDTKIFLGYVSPGGAEGSLCCK